MHLLERIEAADEGDALVSPSQAVAMNALRRGVAISLAVLGEGSGLNLTLAWAYVASRVVHSLFQAMVNKIEVRFAIFIITNIPLIWLTVNALQAVL